MPNHSHLDIITPVRHGLIMAVLALICGALWAAYLALNHEQLHGGFEKQEAALESAQTEQTGPDTATIILDAAIPRAEAHSSEPHTSSAPAGHAEHGQASPIPATAQEHRRHEGRGHLPHREHTHSGSLAMDAMQRLLRGHIHWMGLGILSAVLLLIVAFTSLKPCWKKLLGWTFGIGALAYPPAWILMGFRTVELGPQAAEASVMWLFGPTVGLLLASMTAVLSVLIIEMFHLHKRIPLLSCFFQQERA